MPSQTLIDHAGGELSIDAAQFSCHAVTLIPVGAIASIEYTESLFDQIPDAFLFWGPYIELKAGVYLINFHGQLDGQLMIELVHQEGNMRLKAGTVNDFSRPVCFVLTRSVTDLEVRAVKTPSLRSMTLESIVVHCAYLSPDEQE